ncbi:MAG: hypothetical protein IKG67_13195 [Parasporobacterium sp.]|nr:hypothetical protein [Parasporobacterium sp.]
MKNLETKLGRAVFRNPLFGCSGCVGHAYELAPYTDLSQYGGLSLKTVTYLPRVGNPADRICEVTAGCISSVGLPNKGPDDYFANVVPKALNVLDPDQAIVSVAGDCVEEYVELCERVQDLFGDRIAAVELNAACPNASHGIGYFSRNAKAAAELIHAAKSSVDLPILYKFNTNFENYLEVGKAVSDAGVDAIFTTSTPMGIKIDIKTRKPVLGNTIGPVCGPAVLPFGMLRIWNLYKEVEVPLIASGGAASWRDVIEYMLAGASAVGIGSAHFATPDIVPGILADLQAYMEREKLDSLSELIGAAHR